MPSPFTPSSPNGVKKRRVIPDVFSSTNTSSSTTKVHPHPPNGSSRSSMVLSSPASSPTSSPEKKAKRHTVGSLRKLFGNSTRASFDSLEGQGGGGGQDDHTSIKSGRASSSEDRRPALASSDTTRSPESEPDHTPLSSHPSPPSPPTAAGETNANTRHHHTCREQELQQSLSAVQLELQRLEERVRLLSAENDGFKKEVVDKHKELEDRETKVSELKLDVEIEREKVKKVLQEGVVTISGLKERGMASRSSSLMMMSPGFKVQGIENGHGPGEPVILVEDGGVTTGWSEDMQLANGAELVQDAQAIIEPTEATPIDSQVLPVDAGVSSFTLAKIDVATNTEEEEDHESFGPDNEFLTLKDTLDRQTKALADLASMNDSNSTTKQRLVKFNRLRSQLVLLVEQSNLEGMRLHQELDRSMTWFLVLVFGSLVFGMFVIFFMCVYKFLLEHNYVPAMSMILCSPS